MGLFIVSTVFYIRTIAPSLVDVIASNGVIRFIEKHLFEIYLVHHILIKGSWSVFNFVENTYLSILIVIVTTLIISIVLRYVSQIIVKLI